MRESYLTRVERGDRNASISGLVAGVILGIDERYSLESGCYSWTTPGWDGSIALQQFNELFDVTLAFSWGYTIPCVHKYNIYKAEENSMMGLGEQYDIMDRCVVRRVNRANSRVICK